GHIRRKVLKAFKEDRMDFCDVLFVDEVHNQTIDIGIILTVWREAYTKGMKVPRLLLSSATPISVFPDLPIEYYTIEGVRLYPSYISYLLKDIPLGTPLFDKTIVDLVIDIHTNTSPFLSEFPHIIV